MTVFNKRTSKTYSKVKKT